MKFGPRILEQADRLAAFTEEDGRLTRTYLTPRHRDAGEQIAAWMREAGMLAGFDALGNVVGRYEGVQPGARAVLAGSHMDTVVDAGRYDGTFGILAAIACAKDLQERDARLPFALEVVAFGDEEGVRFGTTLIGSRAFAGRLPAHALDASDRNGMAMRDALMAFGGDPGGVAALSRVASPPLAFIELHIEQGPVLLDEGLPVGVVTSIAGTTRVKVRVTGVAGHAGTVPMDGRRDALTAAAAMALEVERHCVTRTKELVGTVGKLSVAGGGAANVIPGSVDFSIDVRSAEDTVRRDAVRELEASLRSIAAERGVSIAWEPYFETDATPCDPRLQEAFARSVAAHGIAARSLPSGAGHDAIEIARIAPTAMLFVRCGNGGISHNPLESLSAEDAEVATSVLLHFLENFHP
ncbi:MAG: allantoate amidohydrolase [Usitatibacter sp.]